MFYCMFLLIKLTLNKVYFTLLTLLYNVEIWYYEHFSLAKIDEPLVVDMVRVFDKFEM